MSKNKSKKRLIRCMFLIAVVIVVVIGILVFRQIKISKTEAEYKSFLNVYESQVVPLEKEAIQADFDAYISGREEDYEKTADLFIQLNNIYLDKISFEKIKDFKDSRYLKDPILKRQLDLQYMQFMTSLSDKKKIDEITKLQIRAEEKFNTYRVVYRGKKISDNEVENILKTSKNSAQLKAVWEQSKNIGSLLSGDVLKMVKLRNEYAKDLGFENYQQMALIRDGHDPVEIKKIFDDLDLATKDIYSEAKNKIDSALAKQYGINVSELRPWHYQNRFFQTVPGIFNVNLDSLYQNIDVVDLNKQYYEKIGLPIDELVEKSDLYAKPGKYQHAVAFSIDREQDIRVISNVENNAYWAGTLLHEFGHALYFQKIDPQLPWELRIPAHTFTTEAVALFFQSMQYSPQWMREDLKMSNEDIEAISSDALEFNRLDSLIFSRWTQVMYRFEKSMYENPDQDLNKLWWDLVEKYQLVKKPEGRNAPDWATKIHIVQTPIYYHNYMLGHLYAEQLRHYINTNLVKTDEKYPTYSGNKTVGEFLTKKVFAPGARYGWAELIRRSTGEDLNPSYFAQSIKGD